jgi:hypothetical protein
MNKVNGTNGASNGKANGKELSSVIVTGSEMKETQQEPKAETPTAEKKPLTLEDRLKKMVELNQLLERRTLLTDALDDVNGFVHTANDPASIQFTDSKRHGFSISNSLVIADMLQLAKDRLKSELLKVESQITFD